MAFRQRRQSMGPGRPTEMLTEATEKASCRNTTLLPMPLRPGVQNTIKVYKICEETREMFL